MDIVLVRLDARDDESVERAYRIVAASDAAEGADFPPQERTRFVGGLRHPMPGRHTERVLAYRDGVPVGYLSAGLPQLDNLDNVSVELYVHPDHRRRGVGRALYQELLRLAGEHRRKRISGATVEALPGGPARTGAGSAFAAAMGARPVLPEVRRRLDVTALDQSALDRLHGVARAASTGYSPVRWHGPTPEEYVADVAYLDGRLIEDAPLGDLEWEPEKVDSARVRRTEAALAARGRRTYHCGARHDASGRLVAWTMLEFDAAPVWHAYQQITIVDPEHRGHRLGALVKIENLRYALTHEPDLRVIDTWNAAVNDHMISINEALGFRPVDAWHNWQLTI
ncbi:GNAT family N-acetyltransferase [Micromonospora sp. NPDC049559]|uniref:GNAT family N-acetyltransferase n=1 Tax=Micromonospora sp. NPDC049559 TaxID=3155923 RepID=UPI003419330F